MEHKIIETYIISENEIDVSKYPQFLFLREDRIVGHIHLDAAMKYALMAFMRKRNISDSIWKEIMLYLSTQRQVGKAIEIMGIKNYTGKIVVLGEKEFQWEKKFKGIDINEEKLKFWGINSALEILTKMAEFSIENA